MNDEVSGRAGQGTLQLVPVLPVRRLERSLRFYAELGFDGKMLNGEYAILSRDELEIHLFQDQDLDRYTNSGQLFWRVEDVEELHRRFSRRIARVGDVTITSGVTLGFTVHDPDNNCLRICSLAPSP